MGGRLAALSRRTQLSADLVGPGIGRRIVVVGNTGSGKSTVAAQVARAMSASFVELDALFWAPEWTPEPPEVFRRRVAEATGGDAWVVAGNYFSHGARELIWPRAEAIVWLDPPLPVMLWRVTRRSWLRWRDGELLWGTNRERFWPHFYSRESLLLYAVKGQRKLRQRYEAAMVDPAFAHLSWVRHRSTRATQRWLAEAFGGGASHSAAPRAG